MLIIAVIVYDRYENVVRWIHCWNKSEAKEYARLFIIHNNNGGSRAFKVVCERYGIDYILRENVGYDIGAMQDVFRERLIGFPNDWEYLMWCTDDVIPMEKDFPFLFLDKYREGVGITAMHISTEFSPHVRTGCFCIAKDVAKEIIFPADPVKTKAQCYEFEHKGKLTMTTQIRRMGLSCVQVAPLVKSPMYDTNYWRRNKKVIQMYSLMNREAEHKMVFK